jgi:outer membrane protein TolC
MKISGLIIIFAAIAVAVPGCAAFHPVPISPSLTALAFESRTLDSQGLREFMEKDLGRKITPWPPTSWDMETLTLVAFYYHPDMDVARARWATARAGVITASARPNPGAGFLPQYNTRTAGGLSPWTLGFNLDIPIETAGKRGYRIDQAKDLSDAARMDIATAAWRVRSRLRRGLLNLYRTGQTETVLQRQLETEENIVRLLEQRLSLGEVSLPDVTQARISLTKTRLSLREAQRQAAESRVQLADALGLPVDAVNNTQISFNFMKELPPARDIPLQAARRQALLSRPDILSALSKYAASEAALQIEIAKQYPDIHLGPGYTFDQGDNKWAIGLSITLPVLNHNEGPVAEADARRKEMSVQFIALQARIIGEIDRAFTGYRSALQKLETADSLLSTKKEQLQSMQAMFKAGETGRLSILNSQLEFYSITLLQLDALANAQQSLGLLEDALERPLQPLEYLPVASQTNPSTKGAKKK